MLPDSDNTYFFVCESSFDFFASPDIPGDLCRPIFPVLLWHSQTSFAAVPEAAVNEDRYCLLRKPKIRNAYDVLGMQFPALDTVSDERHSQP
jgi:hypothetical protein